MGLTRAAVNRPVFILMLMLAAFLIGGLAYTSMRKELNPDVNFGVVTILTNYPGAGPEEVNTLVSRKIEEAVSGVNGLREVTSSSTEGRSTVIVNLNLDIDVDVALNDIRSKVDAVTPNLPLAVLKPTITKVDTSSTPILYMGFSAKSLDNQALRDLIDDKLVDRYAQIAGVSQVDDQGGDIREIQVQVNKDKLLAYGIGILDVRNAVQNATLNVPSGKMITSTQQYNVRVLGEFQTVDQIRNLQFSVNDPKNPQSKSTSIRLGDVADVQDTIAERTSYSRINGQDAIVVVLQKAKDGNSIDIVAGADKVSAGLEKEYKSVGLKIVKTQDESLKISESLDDLRFSLAFSILLVSVIVFIFLHNFRGTLIVALAIPTSIFGTFIAIKAAGFTINNLSMLALSLAVGVLVDDAIVVLENIYRHLKMGEDPKDAALNGRAEIGLAAIAITLADVVVFLPIGFLSGVIGQFFKPLALGYVFATLFSLFVSFTLTPMLASRWYRKGEDVEHPTGRFAIWFERGFGRLEKRYGRALEWALTHRWFVFISGNAVLVAVFVAIAGGGTPTVAAAAGVGFALMKPILVIALIAFICNRVFFHRWKPMLFVQAALFGLLFPFAAIVGHGVQSWKKEPLFKFAFFPASDNGSLAISIELPPGANLEDTQRVVSQIEKKVIGYPDVTYVLSNVGSQGVGRFSAGNQGQNYAQIVVSLQEKQAPLDALPWAKKPAIPLRTKSTDAITGELVQKVGRIPGADVRIAPADNFGTGSAIQLSFKSDDRELLNRTVAKIAERLQAGTIPGLINVVISSKPGSPEIRAIPDRARMADAGVAVSDVANAMRVLYQGDDNTKFRVNGREYTIRTMLALKDRNNLNVLSQVPVLFKQGLPIYISSIANLQQATTLNKIDRRDRQEEVRIDAGLLPSMSDSAGLVQAEITGLITKEHLVPQGVSYKPLGQADNQAREGPSILIALVIGLVLVYMLLASLYDNLIYPLIIQIAQPQAFVGALLALMITNKPLNLVGIIGLITLIGLVGKNAILLVDYTNTLRQRGRDRHDALVEAGPIRLRPISMTSSALVLGMLPIALAIGRGSEFRETIGITILGGVSLSTVLTLLVIPCSYTIFDDLSIGLGKVARRLAGNRGTPPPEIPAEEESAVTPVPTNP